MQNYFFEELNNLIKSEERPVAIKQKFRELLREFYTKVNSCSQDVIIICDELSRSGIDLRKTIGEWYPNDSMFRELQDLVKNIKKAVGTVGAGINHDNVPTILQRKWKESRREFCSAVEKLLRNHCDWI